MLESVFKHVLDEVRGDHPEDAELNELYQETSEALDMHPMQYDEKVFKSILGSAHNIVDELGDFRNEASDAHGPGPYHLNPRPRHAQLAVNLAGAIADYVVRTCEARQDS